MLKWPLLSRKKNNQKTDTANDVFSKEKYAIDCAEDFSNASPIDPVSIKYNMHCIHSFIMFLRLKLRHLWGKSGTPKLAMGYITQIRNFKG